MLRALAANLIANRSQVTDIRSGDIEKDDIRETKISLPWGGVKIALKKLKTGTVKDVVHSFRTAMPVTKFRGADLLIQEYLLYVLVDVA